MKRPLLRVARFLLIVLGLSLHVGDAPAQPGKPVPPNPQAPNVQSVQPTGIQRGTALDLTLTGTNLAGPTGLWTGFPAKVTIPTTGNNGKDNARLIVHIEVPKDAPLGLYGLRLATTRGMSNLRLFCVDELPQVAETATNRTPAMAQPVPVPCVVMGKADAESTDYYKIQAQPGQQISFEVLGRRLGSALDPQLTLYDDRGRELPGGYSNDAPGLQTDARLTHTFKDAGTYLIGVRDTAYRGGDFPYRLRIGTFPCATTPLPLAGKRGSKTLVHFAGPNVTGVAPLEVSVPSAPTAEAVQVAPEVKGLHGWPVSLAVSDLEEQLEKEPNNEPARASRITVPGAISARFEQKGDKDWFVFAAKKGTRYAIDAQTQELGSPTEVYMVLRDLKDKQIQATNPAAAPHIDFTAPADGDYRLEVEHLHYWGGPEESYRLTVRPYAPDFDLLSGLDRYDVGQGGTVSIPLQVVRRGYTGPIELSVVGPKGLGGKGTIAANQAAGALPLAAAGDLPIGPQVFHIEGRATINGKPFVTFVNVHTVLSQNLAGLPLPPRETFNQLAVAIKERPPFQLTARLDAAPAKPGKPAPLTVTVTRMPGFTAAITLSAVALPPGVTAKLMNIAANQNSVKVQLTLAPNVKPGKYTLSLRGQAKHKGQDYSATTPPVPLEVKK